jgi:hypothetical protein
MRLTQRNHLARLAIPLLVASCAGDQTAAPVPMAHYDVVLTRTLGGAEEGPAMLSDIRGIVVDPQGRVIVLDFATQQIEMFDSAGTHLRTIGRKGAGPGEMESANGLLRAADGALWVNDPGNQRFTVFDPEGNYQRSIPVNITSYGFRWEAWFDSDGALYEPISVRQDTTRVERLQRFRDYGAAVDTLPVPCEGIIPRRTREDNFVFEYSRGMTVMPIPFGASPILLFDRKGHAWCGVSSEYTLRRVGLSGSGDTLALKGLRAPLPVTQVDRDSAIARIREQMAPYQVKDPDWSRIPDLKPVIGGTIVDDSGRVWVNPVVADAGQVWEIFSANGIPVAVVHSPVVFTRYRPLVIQGDKVTGVVLDSNDVAVVVTGRLQRQARAS